MTGADIRALRKRCGLTQAELGRVLSERQPDAPAIHHTTVSRWELGESQWPAYLSWALEAIEAKYGPDAA